MQGNTCAQDNIAISKLQIPNILFLKKNILNIFSDYKKVPNTNIYSLESKECFVHFQCNTSKDLIIAPL